MKTINVRAAVGLKFPMEHSAHRYIEQEAVEVPDSTYYQRALASGDLVEVPVSEPKTEAVIESELPEAETKNKKGGK
jgi:hypothetical protein